VMKEGKSIHFNVRQEKRKKNNDCTRIFCVLHTLFFTPTPSPVFTDCLVLRSFVPLTLTTTSVATTHPWLHSPSCPQLKLAANLSFTRPRLWDSSAVSCLIHIHRMQLYLRGQALVTAIYPFLQYLS
jgi:hypothetical protein